MKNKINHLFILIFILISVQVSGQSLIQTFNVVPSDLTSEEILMLNSYSNLSYIVQSKLIQIGDISQIQTNGQVELTLPFNLGHHKFQSSRVEYENSSNYVYYAERIVSDTIIYPDYILFTNTNGQIGGEISFENKFIRIIPLSGRYQIALFMPDDNTFGGCNNVATGNEVNTTCTVIDNNPCIFKVLVAYPPNVEDKYPAMIPIARMLIEQLNTALSKSNIKHRAKLVGITKLTDIWTDNDLENDLAQLQNMIKTSTSSFLAFERERTKADIVLMLTTGVKYKSTDYGLSSNIPALIPEDACAVAKMEGALGKRLTFTHEIAHLLGGGHDNYTEPARAHSFTSSITKYNYLTVMHLLGSEQRLLRFSNPNVYYAGAATGTETRNNACVMQNAGCGVSALKSGDTKCSFLVNGFFDKPCKSNNLYVSVNTIENEPNGCMGNYYYDFFYSVDGINFTPECPLTFQPFCDITLPSYISYYQTVYIKIVITNINTSEKITLIEWFSPPCDIHTAPSTPRSLENDKNINSLMFKIYPSPALNKINIIPSCNVTILEKVNIIGLEGNIYESKSISNINLEENTLSLDISNLKQGIYFIKIYDKLGRESINKFVKL